MFHRFKSQLKRNARKFIASIISEREGENTIANANTILNVHIDYSIKFGKGLILDFNDNPANVLFEAGFFCKNYCHFLVFNNANLTIKKNVFFNNYCSVNCLGEVEIGENTLFGEGVKIYDHNHLYSYSNNNQLEVKSSQFTIGKIKIGKNCWIGSNVTILNNVEIGDNVIVGANCLIYKSIPANSIVKMKADLIVINKD